MTMAKAEDGPKGVSRWRSVLRGFLVELMSKRSAGRTLRRADLPERIRRDIGL